jgi:hypothetical protein
MQAKRPDAFALRNAGFDAFLYADVGVELNGSTLTLLSVLARLGKDPWGQAARWAALPRAGVIDSLAQSIAQMPLAPSALAAARETAARLVQLLPANAQGQRPGGAAGSKTATPRWVPVTILYFALAVAMVLNLLLMTRPSPTVPVVASQSATVPGAAGPATRAMPGAMPGAMPVHP